MEIVMIIMLKVLLVHTNFTAAKRIIDSVY